MASDTTQMSPVRMSLEEITEELTTRAAEAGKRCVELSEIGEFSVEQDLGEDELQSLQDLLEERGLELRDDCGRETAERTRYVNDNLADRTTDAMSLFLEEVRRHPLLNKNQEIELA